jgi:hypothetical protein
MEDHSEECCTIKVLVTAAIGRFTRLKVRKCCSMILVILFKP